MQVSVESTSALERRMTVGVPAERIETEVNKRLQQTASRAKVPGFRPGKVPMSVIRQRYEDSARQEALGDLIQATYYEAIVAQKLNPAGAPAVEPKVFEKGKDLEYVATFEVFPEVQLLPASRVLPSSASRLTCRTPTSTTCWKSCASRTPALKLLSALPRMAIN